MGTANQRNTNTTSANNNFTLAAIASFEQKILTKKKTSNKKQNSNNFINSLDYLHRNTLNVANI